MSKKKTKNNASKHRILNIVLICCFIIFSVQLVIALVDIGSKQTQISETEQQIAEQNVENNELKRIIESGNSDEYIERIAREKYGLVRPDERVFVNTLGE